MQYLNARRTLAKLIEWGVVPVVNENDTTSTDEISFGDNDILAAQAAILMPADLLVILSDVDALYTGDPARTRRAPVARGPRPGGAAGATRSACRARISARAGCAARCWPPRWRPPPASRS